MVCVGAHVYVNIMYVIHTIFSLDWIYFYIKEKSSKGLKCIGCMYTVHCMYTERLTWN